MAKIRPIDVVKTMSGKVHGRSDYYFRENKINDKTHTGLITKQTKPPSERQVEYWRGFGNYGRQAAQWLRENHPTPENPEGTEAYRRIKEEYKSQRKIGTLIAYVTTRLINSEQ